MNQIVLTFVTIIATTDWHKRHLGIEAGQLIQQENVRR